MTETRVNKVELNSSPHSLDTHALDISLPPQTSVIQNQLIGATTEYNRGYGPLNSERSATLKAEIPLLTNDLLAQFIDREAAETIGLISRSPDMAGATINPSPDQILIAAEGLDYSVDFLDKDDDERQLQTLHAAFSLALDGMTDAEGGQSAEAAGLQAAHAHVLKHPRAKIMDTYLDLMEMALNDGASPHMTLADLDRLGDTDPEVVGKSSSGYLIDRKNEQPPMNEIGVLFIGATGLQLSQREDLTIQDAVTVAESRTPQEADPALASLARISLEKADSPTIATEIAEGITDPATRAVTLSEIVRQSDTLSNQSKTELSDLIDEIKKSSSGNFTKAIALAEIGGNLGDNDVRNDVEAYIQHLVETDNLLISDAFVKAMRTTTKDTTFLEAFVKAQAADIEIYNQIVAGIIPDGELSASFPAPPLPVTKTKDRFAMYAKKRLTSIKNRLRR